MYLREFVGIHACRSMHMYLCEYVGIHVCRYVHMYLRERASFNDAIFGQRRLLHPNKMMLTNDSKLKKAFQMGEAEWNFSATSNHLCFASKSQLLKLVFWGFTSGVNF